MGLGKLMTVAISCGALALMGCSQQPLPLMDKYLGTVAQGSGSAAVMQPERVSGPLNAGLVLINDTSVGRSAPAFSDKAKAFLTDRVRERVEAGTPIRLGRILPMVESSGTQDREVLAKMAQEQGLKYLLVALFSSAESEVPAYLPITGDPEQGGSRPSIPGYEAVNYALAELALIDAASGQVVARSDGRAWTRMNRLNVPMKSNAYPVIHRSLRVAPIYPPEAEAKDIMRSMAGDEALEQAVVRLQEAWPKS
jgi:hypothetical protein